MNTNYLNNCKQLLQAFELTQSEMLQLNHKTAWKEFQVEIDQLEILFNEMYEQLVKKKNVEKKLKVLLTSQIERLQIYIKEFRVYLKKQSVNADEIIFTFERQYKFKAILKKHLTEFAKLM